MRTESQGEPAVGPAPDEFDRFFRQHFPVVARTAALVVHDLEVGQDLAQESFARVYVRWDRIESIEHARNLAFRVALNLARSHLRRVRRRAAATIGRSGVAKATPDVAEIAVDRITLQSALAGLSRRQRTCVALVDYAGFDVRWAARLLRMRPSTVRVHLTRGRRALAEALKPTYKESTDD